MLYLVIYFFIFGLIANILFIYKYAKLFFLRLKYGK